MKKFTLGSLFLLLFVVGASSTKTQAQQGNVIRGAGDVISVVGAYQEIREWARPPKAHAPANWQNGYPLPTRSSQRSVYRGQIYRAPVRVPVRQVTSSYGRCTYVRSCVRR